MSNPTGANQTLTKIYNAVLNALRVYVVSSVLPDGAATAAKQDEQAALLTQIENNTDGLEGSLATLISQTDGVEASLASIDAGIPAALGQTTMSASQPVVIASDQLSTIPSIGQVNTVYAAAVEHVPSGINRYKIPIRIRQSATTAAGVTVFAMRNPTTSTRKVFLGSIHLNAAFDTGTGLTRALLGYDIVRFSAATPTGGTAIAVIPLDTTNATSQVTDARFLDTGLTTTGVVFETPFVTVGVPAVDGSVSHYDNTYCLVLAPGQGLCFRLNVQALVGQSISGHIGWREQ